MGIISDSGELVCFCVCFCFYIIFTIAPTDIKLIAASGASLHTTAVMMILSGLNIAVMTSTIQTHTRDQILTISGLDSIKVRVTDLNNRRTATFARIHHLPAVAADCMPVCHKFYFSFHIFSWLKLIQIKLARNQMNFTCSDSYPPVYCLKPSKALALKKPAENHGLIKCATPLMYYPLFR